jgi:hypothetical protein
LANASVRISQAETKWWLNLEIERLLSTQSNRSIDLRSLVGGRDPPRVSISAHDASSKRTDNNKVHTGRRGGGGGEVMSVVILVTRVVLMYVVVVVVVVTMVVVIVVVLIVVALVAVQ